MASPREDNQAVQTTAVDTSHIEEEVLLQRIKERDPHAFWELWGRYRNECLARYSLKWMTGNHADAEDALSQSSLKAWQYLMDAPRDITCIKSWLTRLLQNHCTDIWKARQKHSKYTQGIVNQSWDGEPVATPTEVSLIQQELGMHLQRAFHNLPPRLREPARLRFAYEMSAGGVCPSGLSVSRLSPGMVAPWRHLVCA
ncbi:hypothetical protein C2W62_10850 [Candidatus Entotheonella serta]|nr:hypothetical protein C2W62_10850 [Candidatus Entotheonella serta]